MASCGAVGGVRAAESAGHVALIQGMDVGGGDAAFAATVGVNERGCLGLVGPDRELYAVVIWPHSTHLDDEGNVHDAHGDVVRVGDAIEAGGGEAPFAERYPEQAERCLSDPTDEDAVVIELWTVTRSGGSAR